MLTSLDITNYRNTCAWNIGLTDTFRNKSKKLLGLYGTNLQNPSDRICQIYIPDNGKVFIQADQAGAEAVIVSRLCRSGNLRKLFQYGIKVHSYVALHIFNSYWISHGHPIAAVAVRTPIDNLTSLPEWKELYSTIKNHDKYYFIGKKTAHSGNYGVGPNTFRDAVLVESENKIIISAAEAKVFLETFHRIFPEIKDWHKGVEDTIKGKPGVLRNLFGYPRDFSADIITDHMLRQAYAFVPQSTVGCITNIALVKLYHYIKQYNLDWDILNNKHDSILVQCNENDWEHCARTLKEFLSMELTAPNGEQFRMGAEVSKGYNWGKYKPDTNPDGMQEIKL